MVLLSVLYSFSSASSSYIVRTTSGLSLARIEMNDGSISRRIIGFTFSFNIVTYFRTEGRLIPFAARYFSNSSWNGWYSSADDAEGVAGASTNSVGSSVTVGSTGSSSDLANVIYFCKADPGRALFILLKLAKERFRIRVL